MTSIDIPRNLPRLVDAQSLRDPSGVSENLEGASTSGADSFDSLLQGWAGRSPRSGTDPQTAGDLEQHEPVVEGNASDASGTTIASSVFTLLQRILPGPEAQNTGANAQNGDPSSDLPSEEMPQPQGERRIPDLKMAPKLMVAVQHQETHFKPVLEKVETGSQPEDGAGEAGNSSERSSTDEAARKPLHPGHLDRQGNARDIRGPIPPSHLSQAKPEIKAQFEDTASAASEKSAIGRSGEHAEGQKILSASAAAPNEGASLPLEMLHRIASAVRSDLQETTDRSPARSPQEAGPVRTMSIKASESALRVLHLQLHPADLGTVSIRMRLSGDSLEMNLHVEREETAQLLRHDTEKLSALLRGSGYRPDTISIHVGEAAAQDRIVTRQQADAQMQGQSFTQGGASQGGRSRDQERQHANTRAEHHNNANEDKIVGGAGSGTIYL